MADWDKRFMDLAEHIASWSKDRKKKVGAVLVDEDRRIISLGFNGIPIGCNDNDESRHVKPKKLFYFEHGEANVIHACAKSGISTKNTTLYVNWFTCASCARAAIQSGIKRIVCQEPDWEGSWGETFKAAKEMLDEAGVEIIYLEK